jgi:hypothetical protein
VTCNSGQTALNPDKADLFHCLTAQLLYLCKPARPDLQTAVSILTTRVQKPDTDNYRKLGRCVRYLKRTSHYPLTLEADSMTGIQWWIDAAYAVHPDMKSRTGGTMTLGKGSVYSSSIRQKLNTRSSTEAELVAVNDMMMSMVLWTRMFLEEQENESAILLEKNGQRSSSKRTRQLEIRYFFVTDNVKRWRLSIQYCPTEEMIADFFTKPLQGSAFRKMVKLIMNIGDDMMLDPSPQECVDNNGAAVDQQMEAKSPVGEEMHPPIRKDSDETEWKIVVPKGRRSYTKNVMKREKAVETLFLAQNKFVKV